MRGGPDGSNITGMEHSESGDQGEMLAAPRHSDAATTYVVHPHRVIAEDLRDILKELGIADVGVATRLADIPVAGVALAVVAASAGDLAALPHLRAWAERSVPVVVLDARLDGLDPRSTIAHLSQPFEPSDVATVLRRLGVI